MIKFSCRCNHIFELDEEMAGKQVQCPDCHRLVDVPTHQELAELAEDGTVRMESPVAADPHAFEKMRQIYGKEKLDEFGQEIDIRQTYEDLAAAGTEDNPDEFEAHPTAPKYDPVTGELVRPLEISESDRAEIANAVPFANATLSYATPELSAPSASMIYPLLELLMPVNLTTMFFVLLAHIILILSFISILLAFFALFIVGFGLIAHYANVVEDIAIEERDELPRFLRHFNIADDICLPAVRVILSAFVCFAPNVLARIWFSHHEAPIIFRVLALVSLDIVGFILFPAVFMIMITSGTISNLRPDRIFGTMARIGWRYVPLVMLFMVAFEFYYWGMIATANHALSILTWQPVPWFLNGYVSYGTLIVAIYLMHYFTWTLALCYRKYHDRFPWVYLYERKVIPGVNAPRHAPMARPTQTGK